MIDHLDIADRIARLGPVDRPTLARGVVDECDATVTRIPLQNDQWALVDTEDYSLVEPYKWKINNHGYVVGYVGDDKRMTLHRMVMMAARNSKRVLDHINRNRLDCRKANLRFCTHAENGRNRGANPNNKSGTKGLYLDRGYWRATVDTNLVRTFRLFKDRSEAEAWLMAERAIQHGEFVCHQ